MKVTCDIVKDILPLYVEEIVSADSSALVEEHIAFCMNCKKELERLRVSDNMPIEANIAPLKKIQSTLLKKTLLAILLSITLTLTITIIAICYLNAPNYLPYSDDTMNVGLTSDGTLLVIFGNNVTGYDVNKYLSSDNSGYVYHITAWNSIWNRNISKSSIQNFVLNPHGENIISVYYYLTDGSKDILVYGEGQDPNGGVVTLPRLFLSYYAIIAFVIAAVCGLMLFLMRKSNKAKNIIMSILLLPIAYLLAHLCIKGFASVSYSATRDFWAILLLTFPLYIILYIFNRLFANKKTMRTE